jgi:hypothetical protein
LKILLLHIFDGHKLHAKSGHTTLAQ